MGPVTMPENNTSWVNSERFPIEGESVPASRGDSDIPEPSIRVTTLGGLPEQVTPAKDTQGSTAGEAKSQGDWPAGDDNHRAFDGGADVVDDVAAGFENREVCAVSEHLCVWGLAHHNDGVGEVVGVEDVRHVNAEQTVYVDYRVALVRAINRATIPDEMLGTPHNFCPSKSHHSHSMISKTWIMKSKLVPGDTKPNIVGEDGGLINIIVAMNCINSINDGNPEAGRKSTSLKLVKHVNPILNRGLRCWPTPSTTHYTPCTIPSSIKQLISLLLLRGCLGSLYFSAAITPDMKHNNNSNTAKPIPGFAHLDMLATPIGLLYPAKQ
nr:Os02g0131500 [Ipomoea trifida]